MCVKAWGWCTVGAWPRGVNAAKGLSGRGTCPRGTWPGWGSGGSHGGMGTWRGNVAWARGAVGSMLGRGWKSVKRHFAAERGRAPPRVGVAAARVGRRSPCVWRERAEMGSVRLGSPGRPNSRSESSASTHRMDKKAARSARQCNGSLVRGGRVARRASERGRSSNRSMTEQMRRDVQGRSDRARVCAAWTVWL